MRIIQDVMEHIKAYFQKHANNSSHTLSADIKELIATYILNVGYYILYIFPQRDELKRTKELKNTKKGKNCFVFANGPSMNLLDVEKIEKYQKAGFDAICMNSYIISDMAKMIIPDYYVLSDPASFFVASNRLISDDVMKTQEKQNKVLNELNIPLFMPAEYSSLNLFKNYYLFYNFGNRFKSYVNPLKPRGYPTTTAHKALTIACYLGYDEIYICGFDHDFFKNILVDKNNNPYLLVNHYYDEIEIKVIPETGKNVSTFLWEQHQLFKNLERFKKYNIINLDTNGLVDTFPKNHNLNIYTNHR